MNPADYSYLLRYSVAKKGALKAYKNAIKHQHLQPEELENLSWLKTQKLLAYAYNNVKWYNDTFKAINLHPRDITKPEHFYQVPILKRTNIIEHFDDFIANGVHANNLSFITTGGSSGTPLKIGVTKKRVREVQKWQMFNWWETALNANMASIYRGLPVKGIKKIALDVINWPQEVLRFDATNITTSSIEQFISDYNTVKPKIIHGYVGAVDTIADYILEHDIRFDFQPNAIWLTAAPITSIQEHKISKAFQSKVCDQYGCSEIFFIAAECPHKKGLHVFSDSVKLEIVDEKGKPVQDGTFGKIILTNLDEFSFPLIRYENGDEGRYLTKTCDCNLSLPLIDKVKGRISDNLTLPDGRILSGEYLTTIFDDFTDNVKQFQIIQLKNLDLLVRVNLYNQHDAGFIKKMILNEFLPKIKNQVAIKIEIVQSIKQDKGKIQFIVKE